MNDELGAGQTFPAPNFKTAINHEKSTNFT